MQLSLLDQPGLRAWSPSRGSAAHVEAARAEAAPADARGDQAGREQALLSDRALALHPGARTAPFPAPGAHPSGQRGAESGVEPGARRLELGCGAWVELVPSWLPEQAALFELLARTADWERHRRTMYDRVVEVPRLVAGMPGEPSDGLAFGGGANSLVERLRHRAPSREVREAAAELRWLAVTLSHRYQRTLTDVSLAYYRDGHDSVAYHGDKLGAGRMDSVVAILSLGARRRFLLRRVRQERAHDAVFERSERDTTRVRALAHEETTAFELGEGDLLVMGGTCQETFEHAVPKAKLAGPRIAVMFRQPEHLLARRAERALGLRSNPSGALRLAR